MLRINLLEDTQPETGTSAVTVVLIGLAGALILILCACVALAGWFSLQTDYESALVAQQQAQTTLDNVQPQTIAPDYSGLVSMEQATLNLQALAQHQTQTPPAIEAALVALHIEDLRIQDLDLHAVHFDGQTLTADGRARTMETLEAILTRLQEADALHDVRFTSLRAADAPINGRPQRDTLNAVDFTLYATIDAPPITPTQPAAEEE